MVEPVVWELTAVLGVMGTLVILRKISRFAVDTETAANDFIGTLYSAQSVTAIELGVLKSKRVRHGWTGG